MRKQLAQRHPALPIAIEFPGGAEQRFRAFEEGEPLTLHEALRWLLATEFGQLWLILEELELARPTSHEEKDDVLRPGSKL
jgi:hypothetical protein